VHAFLARLKKEGLTGLDTAASQSSQGVLHGEKRLSATLEPTLEQLSDAGKRAMGFAALLPPDQVALPWLRGLVLGNSPKWDGTPNQAIRTPRKIYSARCSACGCSSLRM
jgi:hypothetical protein